VCFRIFTYSLATSHTLNVDHLVYACFNVFIKLENMFYVFLFQNHCFNKYTQRIRSRLAAPRRVCGVGVRKARQVLFSADASPKGFLVDRSTFQSQCGISLHDITRPVTLPNFFRHSTHFYDYFRFSKSQGQILDFQKFEILIVDPLHANMRHHAKFRLCAPGFLTRNAFLDVYLQV